MKTQNGPFVIGVLANLSGQPAAPLPQFKDRRFATVTRESFARLFRSVGPRIGLSLLPEGHSGTSPAGLTFESLEEFAEEILAHLMVTKGIAKVEEAAPAARRVLADPAYQALRATWQGLWYLARSGGENPDVSVKVLNVSKRDVLRDLQRAPEFDQSALFKKVYQEAIGTFGGEAFNCLVGDFSLCEDPEDFELLRAISKVAGAARAPFLWGMRPEMFNVERWPDLDKDCAMLYRGWEELRNSSEAGTIFPLLPRFNAGLETGDASGRAWMNPAYLVASLAARSHRETELLDSAQRFFPEWSYGTSRPQGAPPPGGSPAPEIEFEWDCPGDLQATLSGLGINAITRAILQREDFLERVTPAASHSIEGGRPALASALAWCNLMNQICDRVRRER